MLSNHRTATAIRPIAFGDLGLLAPLLAAAGWKISDRDASTDELSDPSIAGADLLIVLGGPIGIYQTAAYPFPAKEAALLERRLARGLPTLGIGLGAQLMAAALAGRAFAGPVKEIGWERIDLTEAGRNFCLSPLARKDGAILHWHGDTFEPPAGATRLACNAHYQNQAFAYGPNALALPFHAKADPSKLENGFVSHAAE